MAFVATRGPYALKVEYDDFAPNPREDEDNLGAMACWHRHYNLGDKNPHGSPRDLLLTLVQDVPDKEIIAYAKKGVEDVRLNYDRSRGGWLLESYCDEFKKWFEEYFVEGKLAGSEQNMADAIRECLPMDSLMELTERNYCISPLYLMDHSGISISMSSFHDPWDSGQVGWVYVSREKIKEEYGAVTPETIAKAETALRGETERYDCYLTGQCYGYELYKDGVEDSSCHGFLGSLHELGADIEGYLPDECKGMTDELRPFEAPVRALGVLDFWTPPDEDEAQEADEGEER